MCWSLYADYVLEGSQGTPFEGTTSLPVHGTRNWLYAKSIRHCSCNLHILQWILTLTFVLGTSRALPFLAVAWTREHVFSMHLFLTKMLDLAGGVYHGKVKFPPEYPFKPPGIRFTFP